MIVHLLESTLLLAIAILIAHVPRLAARTRYAIVFAALMKFAIPSAIVPRVLAALGIDLTGMKGTIVITALGPLSTASVPQTSAPIWPMIAVTLWAAIAIALLARSFVRGRAAMRLALSDSAAAGDRDLAALASARQRAGVTRDVRLIRSSSVSTPATAGLLRPIIVIPSDTELAGEELETILTHECAHVARRDNLLSVIESIAGSALWFHPLVWIARRVLNATREEACDAVVISSGDANIYVSALGRVCGAAIAPRAAGISCISCIVSNTIQERMNAIMRFGTRRLLPHRAVTTAVIALLAAVTIGSGVARALPQSVDDAAAASPFRVEVNAVRADSLFNFFLTIRTRTDDKIVNTARLTTRVEEWGTTQYGRTDVDGEHKLVIRVKGHADGTATVETVADGAAPLVQTIGAKGASLAVVAGGQPLPVGGDVKAPVVTYKVEPIYPAEARRERISGIVILECVIDRNGFVKDISVRKPLPNGLSEAAVDAVKQWTFKPGTLNGEAVDVIFNLTINFKLDATSAGKPDDTISIDLRDAEIRDVLHTFSKLTNTEIIVDDDVTGRTSITMNEVPWTEALEIVLRTNNLRQDRAGNTIYVHRK
jgi:TonB family protein